MKIMLDLDGVIWNIMEVFVEIYNEQFNENVKYEDVDDWWFFDYDKWKVVYPLTLPRIMDYKVFVKNVEYYICVLNEKHDVTILTAEANTVDVLTKKLDSIGIFQGTHYDKIIRTEPNGHKTDYEADIYIDDNPNLANLMANHPDRFLLLYEQPWNKKFDDTKTLNVWRVLDWNDIMLAVNMIACSKKGE